MLAISFLDANGQPVWIRAETLEKDRRSKGSKYYEQLDDLKIDLENKTWSWKEKTYPIEVGHFFPREGSISVAFISD